MYFVIHTQRNTYFANIICVKTLPLFDLLTQKSLKSLLLTSGKQSLQITLEKPTISTVNQTKQSKNDRYCFGQLDSLLDT